METEALVARGDRGHRLHLDRGAPRGLRLLTAALFLVAGCAGSPSGPGGGTAQESLAPHETYVLDPTEIRADEVMVNLPAVWRDDVEVSGLSAGWLEKDGRRRWEGTGDCRLSLHELQIRANRLNVTIVPEREEPEFLLSAEGDVVLAHVSRGIGNLSYRLDHLFIRNEKRIER